VEGEEMSRAYTSIKPIPLEVRKRLEKLMLLLGSGNAGEASNAAALITALLTQHALDWHDVVGAIGSPAAKPDPFAPPPPPAGSNPGRMGGDELRALIHRIERSPLNDRARQFLAGMRDRADIYDEVFFSDKQWKWLEDLRKRAEAYDGSG
jgi:hypothetical protein